MQEISTACIKYKNTYNFRTKARTDFKYVPKGSLKIAFYDYQQTQNR